MPKPKPKKPIDQPAEPARLGPIADYHERKIAEARAAAATPAARAAAKAIVTAEHAVKAVAAVERATKRAAKQAARYMPTRGKIDAPRSAASSVLRAVAKGGEIQLTTLTELLELLAAKTTYQFHIAVEILPTGSTLLKTIDNERDAQETIRRLKAKKS